MKMPRRKGIFILSFIVLMVIITAYAGSYISFRYRHIEVWENDNHAYVIFPKDALVLYYFYRPFSLIDAKLTGMRFHIGPHRM